MKGQPKEESVWTESLTILHGDDCNELPMAKCKKLFPTCSKYLPVGSHLQTYTVEDDSNLGVVSESFLQN